LNLCKCLIFYKIILIGIYRSRNRKSGNNKLIEILIFPLCGNFKSVFFISNSKDVFEKIFTFVIIKNTSLFHFLRSKDVLPHITDSNQLI